MCIRDRFKHYLAKLQMVKAESIELSDEFERQLLDHEWLGNVREIKSAALRFHAFGGDNSSGEILGSGQNESSLVDEDLKIDLAELSRTVESLVVESLLAKNLSKNEIAKALGISRQALYKKLNKTIE